MAYTVTNFKTKKELKAAVLRGDKVRVFQPNGLSRPPVDGTVYLEGPHYPQPHTWYAQAELRNGYIVGVK